MDEEDSLEGDDTESSKDGVFSGVKRVVEGMTVTPFFEKHSAHMAATLKLESEFVDKGKYLVLTTRVPGFSEENIDVSASENSIHIKLRSGEELEGLGGEADHDSDVVLNSTYVTPVPVNPDKVKVKRKGDYLEVTVVKM